MIAVEQAAFYIQQGSQWCAELDIYHFFDYIDHQILLSILREKIQDEAVLHMILAYLKCTILNDHIISQKNVGLLQGGALSPLLSNIYLNDLDHYMEKQGYQFSDLEMILIFILNRMRHQPSSFKMSVLT